MFFTKLDELLKECERWDEEEINIRLTTNNKTLGELLGNVTTQDIRLMLDELKGKVSIASNYFTLSDLVQQYQIIAEELLKELEDKK